MIKTNIKKPQVVIGMCVISKLTPVLVSILSAGYLHTGDLCVQVFPWMNPQVPMQVLILMLSPKLGPQQLSSIYSLALAQLASPRAALLPVFLWHHSLVPLSFPSSHPQKLHLWQSQWHCHLLHWHPWMSTMAALWWIPYPRAMKMTLHPADMKTWMCLSVCNQLGCISCQTHSQASSCGGGCK